MNDVSRSLTERRLPTGGHEPIASVILPAHNEERSLRFVLEDLLGQDCLACLHIVVVANGCTDRTASVARSFTERASRSGHRLTVVELAEANKAAALNAGEAVCSGGARLFVDADVALSRNAVSEVLARLDPRTGVHHCAPALRAAPPTSGVVGSYVRIWSQLPYVRDQVIGCGFYAVSPEGRQRWERFPDIISDDKFVRLHFRPVEHEVATTAWFRVSFPERLSELVRVRGRWCRGNDEVDRAFPGLVRNDRTRWLGAARFLLGRPSLWADLPVFVGVFATGRLLAFRARSTGTATWERAASSPARTSSSPARTGDGRLEGWHDGGTEARRSDRWVRVWKRRGAGWTTSSGRSAGA